MPWLILLTELAIASPPPDLDARIALRGIAEQWSEPAIASVYRSGMMLGGAAVVLPVPTVPLGAGLELGYLRMEHGDEGPTTEEQAESGTLDYGETPVLELVPVSVLIEWYLVDAPAWQAYLAAGPTLTSFTERYGDADGAVEATSGARIAAEVRMGLRIDTGLIDPPAAPASSPIEALEIEIYGGRRAQRPGAEGFDLSAWRGAIGLSLRL